MSVDDIKDDVLALELETEVIVEEFLVCDTDLVDEAAEDV